VVHPLITGDVRDYMRDRKGCTPEGGEAVLMADRLLVSVVDDDESVRESLPDLLAVFGFDALTFASAEAFLLSDALPKTRCLILDIAMPGMSGPDLYRELLARGHAIPTIFISAHSNEALQSDLMKRGAVMCLCKPFKAKDLRIALQMAVSPA
jgi:FixJ family two-component response regulator